MVAHSGTTDVREVLGVGSTAQYAGMDADIENKIDDVDSLIDIRLGWHDLSVSGSDVPLITKASKYWAAAEYQQDYKVGKDKEIGKSTIWWNSGSTFLWGYIQNQTETHERTASRVRRMYSTTTKDPS